MNLTGKCKEDFLKWYKDVYSKQENIHEDGNSSMLMPQSMQWGVIQDFADSVGVNIEVTPHERFNKWWSFYFEVDGVDYQQNAGTRQKARTAALEKFNQLYNTNNG